MFTEFKSFKTDLLNRMYAMEDKLSTFIEAFVKLEESNKKLHEEVNHWKSRVEHVESNLNNNSIDMCGVPFVEKESIINTIIHIVNAGVGINCSANDIDYCYRKSSSADRKVKSEIVCVRFVTKWKKDEILRRMQKLNQDKTFVTTKIINNTTEPYKRIYFNETLTPTTRHIFNIANRKRKDSKIHHVWIRNSKVFYQSQ